MANQRPAACSESAPTRSDIDVPNPEPDRGLLPPSIATGQAGSAAPIGPDSVLADQDLDDIVELARRICDASHAWVSLSVAGVATTAWLSLTAAVASGTSMVIIPDLTLDARTRDNALVAGEPHLQFYAGVPLLSPDGTAFGAISVAGGAPRPDGLDERERRALSALARQVAGKLALSRAINEHNASDAHYRTMFGSANVGFCLIEIKFDQDGRAIDYQFLDVNPAFEQHTGIVMAVGRWMRHIAPDHEEHWFATYGRVATSGVAVRFEGQAAALGRWYRASAFRIGAPELRQVGILLSDFTQQHLLAIAVRDSELRLHEQRQIVTRELTHRTKNTFHVVQAIAQQTFRHLADRDAVMAFERRITKLGDADHALVEQNWKGAPLRSTIERAVLPFADAARFSLDGDDMDVGPQTALSLSLLLNELGTNALKYGALSTHDGMVSIRWSRDQADDPIFHLLWTEQGGPPAQVSERRGFGSRLIEKGLIGTGSVTQRYLPQGLTAAFDASLHRLME